MSALTLRNIPDDLRNQYKAVLAKEGRNMTEDLIAHMRRVVEADKKAGGKAK